MRRPMLSSGAVVVGAFVGLSWPADVSAQEGRTYLRGDANGSGTLDLSDAVYVLGFLFTGGLPPPCRAEADANASGGVDLSDAVAILAFLFVHGAPLPPISEEERMTCNAPQVLRSGTFTTEMHGVRGIAEHLSNRTIRLREFYYDGDGGTGVYIWLHRGGDLRLGRPIGRDLQVGYPGYVNAEIIVPIPESITDDTFHSVAIWCTTFDLNFGSARLR